MQDVCGSGKAGLTKVQHSAHVCMEKAKEMGVFSTFHRCLHKMEAHCEKCTREQNACKPVLNPVP